MRGPKAGMGGGEERDVRGWERGEGEERGKGKENIKNTTDLTQSFELLASVGELYKYIKGVERQIAWKGDGETQII
jgi:hypothetical protein